MNKNNLDALPGSYYNYESREIEKIIEHNSVTALQQIIELILTKKLKSMPEVLAFIKGQSLALNGRLDISTKRLADVENLLKSTKTTKK